MGPSTPLRVLGGEAPAMCVSPMVLPLILSVTFVSRRKEQDEVLDGFVPRNDAMRLFFGGFLPSLLRRASSQ